MSARFFLLVSTAISIICTTPLSHGKSESRNGNEDQLKQTLAIETKRNHQARGYGAARTELFGTMALEQKNGEYFVRDVYCEKDFGADDFPSGEKPGPGKIPNANILNTEHTWPQSKFAGGERETKKSDLHHLFPSDNDLNSVRGNASFGEVTQSLETLKCPQSKIGRAANQSLVFEPPNSHKGNVARALFYFSIRYNLRIDFAQEADLKQWHQLDPVDTAEIQRNDSIQQFQGNRNPFIDHPELVAMIGDF